MRPERVRRRVQVDDLSWSRTPSCAASCTVSRRPLPLYGCAREESFQLGSWLASMSRCAGGRLPAENRGPVRHRKSWPRRSLSLRPFVSLAGKRHTSQTCSGYRHSVRVPRVRRASTQRSRAAMSGTGPGSPERGVQVC